MNGVDLSSAKGSLVVSAYPEADFDPSVKKTVMLDLYIYPEAWKRIKKVDSSDNTKPNVSAVGVQCYQLMQDGRTTGA